MSSQNDDGVSNGQHASHTNGETSDTRTQQQSCTVLIIGGGPVGCLTAVTLGQAGIDVQIVEKLSVANDSPRACGYYGTTQLFLQKVGLYQLVRNEGFMTRGLCWRDMPKDDGHGGKVHGDVIASQPLCAPDDTVLDAGSGLLNLPQGQLNKLLLREALNTGHVQISFHTELASIVTNNQNGVTVLTRDIETGKETTYRATYLVGADGARSATRKALGLAFPGHTWPERLLATNVMVKNVEHIDYHTHYVLHPVHYGIATPLEDPVVGQTTLWRYAIASDPKDQRSDEELLTDENIFRL